MTHPTPEARRLWALLERENLLTVNWKGETAPDYPRIGEHVREHQGCADFKAGYLAACLDRGHPMPGEIMRQLCDALEVDVRQLLYDEVPQAKPLRAPRLDRVLRMPC